MKGSLTFSPDQPSAATTLDAVPGTLRTALGAGSTAGVRLVPTTATVKSASRTTISGTRSGNAYTLTVSGKSYSMTRHVFAGTGVRIAIDRHTSAGWRQWRVVSTATSGSRTITFTSTARYAYRARVLTAAHISGSTSRPVTPGGGTAIPAAGRGEARMACTVWHLGDGQDAADGSAYYDEAAIDARLAAGRSSYWKPLAANMTFVSSLPETGNTDSDIAKATVALRAMQATCGSLGVAIAA